ncbi:MAG: TetR/AcrR family transcriptional regulator [Xanthobacteraceae bacterium]
MARAPRRGRQGRSNGNSTPPDSPPPPPSGSDRERIVAAFMGLLAERPIEEIERAEIAARAGVSLATLRGEFDSALGILAAHIKEIDRAVLNSGDADMAEEPARERLFDALMRRIEALAPYKEAIRSLLRSLRRHPGLAFAVNGLAVRSQRWMLTAAGLDSAGPPGALRAQGLAVLFARVLRVWVDDDDPGLARTMAALDRELARGQRWAGFLSELCRLAPSRRLCRLRSRRRRRRDDDDDRYHDEDAVLA